MSRKKKIALANGATFNKGELLGVSGPCEDCGEKMRAFVCRAGFVHAVVCEKCHAHRYPAHELDAAQAKRGEL